MDDVPAFLLREIFQLDQRQYDLVDQIGLSSGLFGIDASLLQTIDMRGLRRLMLGPRFDQLVTTQSQRLRRSGELECQPACLRHTSFGQELLAYRSAIERDFGQATALAGGMGPLPA
jgi:hypothetical protein